MREVEDWNFIDDKVVYEFSDGSQETIERDLFEDYIRKVDIYFVYTSEDDGYNREPTDKEYEADERKFFNDYFKDK